MCWCYCSICQKWYNHGQHYLHQDHVVHARAQHIAIFISFQSICKWRLRLQCRWVRETCTTYNPRNATTINFTTYQLFVKAPTDHGCWTKMEVHWSCCDTFPCDNTRADLIGMCLAPQRAHPRFEGRGVELPEVGRRTCLFYYRSKKANYASRKWLVSIYPIR